VEEVILGTDALGFWRGDAFVAFVTLPKLFWRWKVVQREFALDTAAGGGTVMLIEAIAVAAEHRGYVQDGGVIQPLLYACHDRMFVVLRLNDGDRDIGFVVKDVIRPLTLATGGEIALYIDTAIGEADFL